MIPYIEVYVLKIGPMTFSPFGFLVAIAVFGGIELARRRAKKRGEDVAALTSFVWWMLTFAFVTAHVFDEIFYHPMEVVRRPWSLLFIWQGISSFGGFIGCVVGGIAWKYIELEPTVQFFGLDLGRPKWRATPRPVLPIGDTIAAVFPTAWISGRLGCAIVHDYPGARASAKSLLAVAYGPGPSTEYGFFELHHGWAPRYDLGLLELIFTVLIAGLFAATWNKKLPLGTYCAASLLLYAPVRFALDFLRAEDADGGDPRYFLLTPGQWAAIAMFAGGLLFVAYLRARPARAELAPATS